MIVVILSLVNNQGQRSLADTLVVSSETKSSVQEVDDSDIHVPDEIQEIVGLLLQGLLDKDTIVRWSAAKGLARLAERLPRDFAEQIIDSVVDLFALDCIITGDANDETMAKVDVSNVSDATWHGTCLCIAEMARRGLLVPSSLDRVIPWISRVCMFF
jgi:hypothetical protein